MNRIDQVFQACRAEGRAAMIYYLTAGFPDALATEEAVDALAAGGCDVLELGFPFSDPIADGPTIQRSSYEALKGGVTVGEILELCGRIRARHPQLPIVLFTAYNLIFHLGDEAFCAAAAKAGADAVLAPDLPPEEAASLLEQERRQGLHQIFLVAPTTTPERAKMIADACGGFVYYVSLKGVTGARAALPADLHEKVAALKGLTDKPVAVGFGVSTPEQAGRIAAFADGVIVGSALIKLMGEAPDRAAMARGIHGFAAAMRAAAGRR